MTSGQITDLVIALLGVLGGITAWLRANTARSTALNARETAWSASQRAFNTDTRLSQHLGNNDENPTSGSPDTGKISGSS